MKDFFHLKLESDTHLHAVIIYIVTVHILWSCPSPSLYFIFSPPFLFLSFSLPAACLLSVSSTSASDLLQPWNTLYSEKKEERREKKERKRKTESLLHPGTSCLNEKPPICPQQDRQREGRSCQAAEKRTKWDEGGLQQWPLSMAASH